MTASFTVRLSPTSFLNWKYDNGTAGVGATYTNPHNGAVTFAGVVPALNDRVLLALESVDVNGIYTVTTVGTSSIQFVLTRATDYDQPGEINQGDLVTVTAGSNANFVYTQLYPQPSTIGTDPIAFVSTSAVTSGGMGTFEAIDITGTTDASSTSTGSLVSSGGIGLAKSIFAGGNLTALGTLFELGSGVSGQAPTLFLIAASSSSTDKGIIEFAKAGTTPTANGDSLGEINIFGVKSTGASFKTGRFVFTCIADATSSSVQSQIAVRLADSGGGETIPVIMDSSGVTLAGTLISNNSTLNDGSDNQTIAGAVYTQGFLYTPIYSSTYSTTTTLLASDMNKGIVDVTASVTLTFDTGTNVYNAFALGGVVPYSNIAKRLMIVNTSGSTVTLDTSAGGVTGVLSSSTLSSGQTGNYIIQITGVNTYTIYGGP